ncbi:hypothetical protein GCM10010954_20300 [Halobacillus andaensis]|uniref:DUF5316 domain-containing protein n=1 Tax=Halobacillus andaensis TaxID=1176239 RepID=A0A917EVR1_HALAA|nr:DUF5316 domain-containing protein [Halobacillus andaensis]MBP2004463.1 hypothetical protein [Halobacillus andaensis]GGF21411.1 hypothetical protein GCM10010954_20300 [Halobacillus andaensis]
MLKYAAIGVLMLFGASVAWWGMGEWHLFLRITAFIALVPLLLAGVLTGAFISGDQNRANFYSESKRDRAFKSRWSKRLVCVSAPSALFLIALFIEYFVTK